MNRDVNHRAVRMLPPNSREQPRSPGWAIFSEQAWQEIACRLKLSGRELQIVRGIFDDETDLAIAGRIGISLSTEHTHVERLHHKLSIMDRPQLLLRVMQEFLTLSRHRTTSRPSARTTRRSSVPSARSRRAGPVLSCSCCR